MAALNFFIYRAPEATEIMGFKSSRSSVGTKKNSFVIAPFDPSRHATIAIPADSPISVNDLNDLALAACKEDTSQRIPSTLHSTTEEEHADMISKVIDKMQNGSLDKCVIARIIVKEGNINVAETFLTLCSRYSNAYVFCFYSATTGLWLGASPERLLSYRNGRLKTMALAGTKQIAATEPWDKKNLEEHRIVKEFICREFSRHNIKHIVSDTETINAGPVKHLRTCISSVAQPDDIISESVALNLAARLSPTPALSGFPKTEASRQILSVEPFDRTYYGGYIGFLDREGNFDFYVNLRSMRVSESVYCLFCGGGIMPDSFPDAEWEETERKSRTILECVVPNRVV